MSSSVFTSNSIVLAKTMIFVSGTVIFLAFHLHKQPTTTVTGATKFTNIHHPRPCISIDGKKKVKKKKKVRFAEDVMEPSGSGEEFRKRGRSKNYHFRKRGRSKIFHKWRTSSSLCKDEGGKRKINMPVVRTALCS